MPSPDPGAERGLASPRLPSPAFPLRGTGTFSSLGWWPLPAFVLWPASAQEAGSFQRGTERAASPGGRKDPAFSSFSLAWGELRRPWKTPLVTNGWRAGGGDTGSGSLLSLSWPFLWEATGFKLISRGVPHQSRLSEPPPQRPGKTGGKGWAGQMLG